MARGDEGVRGGREGIERAWERRGAGRGEWVWVGVCRWSKMECGEKGCGDCRERRECVESKECGR